ncbi:MAG: alkaline phosphatase family protein [Actinomycetota bacterium]
MVVLDAFPNALVDAELTPTLHRLAEEGGRSRAGGVAETTAATYPNHATFVTGRPTVDHGVITNKVLRGGLWVDAAKVGPAVPTLFDACRAEGRSSVAVVGDQNLVGVCGARTADVHWPPQGVVPDGTPRSASGYLPDDEVIRVLGETDLDVDFVFVQIDEVDGARHRFGAWSDEASEQCHRTDAALGRLVEQLRPRWDDTVLVVLSDHDQEDVGRADPADFAGHLPDGVEVCHQGTASLLVGPMTDADLLALPGVVGATSLDEAHHVVWGAPGQVFGAAYGRGDHGSPRTATQLALVGGGHPAAIGLADRISTARPPATRWAGEACELLGLTWRPGAPIVDLTDRTVRTGVSSEPDPPAVAVGDAPGGMAGGTVV